MRIWFGGSSGIERPRRTNDSTIRMRVNDVAVIRIAGARASTVRTRTTLMGEEMSFTPSIVADGAVVADGWAGDAGDWLISGAVVARKTRRAASTLTGALH